MLVTNNPFCAGVIGVLALVPSDLGVAFAFLVNPLLATLLSPVAGGFLRGPQLLNFANIPFHGVLGGSFLLSDGLYFLCSSNTLYWFSLLAFPTF